jgi:hypothetical protein
MNAVEEVALVMNAVSHPNCIAIALVDNTKLHESKTKDKNDDGIGYIGHYVIICGCSPDPSHLDLAQQPQDGDSAPDDHKKDRCLVLMNVRIVER